MMNENSVTKVVMNWSSGKDAALAYHILNKNKSYKITHLLTTLSADYNRVFMHGIREQLLNLQAEQMSLPLIKIKLPAHPDDSVYNIAMAENFNKLKQVGVTQAAYGDIFLEDLKQYRENNLAKVGFKGIFPLWKKDTKSLIDELEQVGIEAIIVCVNTKYLDKDFLGKKITKELIATLPKNVDPCGENGEFHTFVYNAPFFKTPIAVNTGEIVFKAYPSVDEWDSGFYFLDTMQ